MLLLLDTHAFLWFIGGDERLSDRARRLIEDPENPIFVSSALLWEIAIKIQIGKLSLAVPFAEVVPRELSNNRMEVLPIRINHLNTLLQLPFHHRDPFDRLLIAQAVSEEIPVITRDSAFGRYEVETVW